MQHFIRHLRMLRSFCCLQLMVSDECAEQNLRFWHSFLQDSQVVLVEIVKDSWLEAVWALSQES